MIKAVLIRWDKSDAGNFGQFTCGTFNRPTGELPSRGNRPFVSCVPPAGKYLCKKTYSPKFKRQMYILIGAKGRWGIRFHSATFMGDKKKGFRSQLLGCISMGNSLGWHYGQKAVFGSKKAIADFEKYMNGEDFELEIKDARKPR